MLVSSVMRIQMNLNIDITTTEMRASSINSSIDSEALKYNRQPQG